MEKPPVLRIKIPKMPSDAIINRNKLINDLLEMPSLSDTDFKKGIALRDGVWLLDKESIRKEQEEEGALIQRARQDTVREITKEIEKVENPFITEPPEQGIEEWAGFEHCRQKILSVLKEK